jgi:hypothetical protein
MVGMVVRRGLILIFLLLLSIAVAVKLLEMFNVSFGEKADASKFVLEDLASKYPGADIAVMSITPEISAAGTHYLEVEARVTEGAQSPCPKRSHIYYNYPVQNFVPQPPEVITSGCRVCVEAICTIAFPEEAIIASHTLKGTETVQSFLDSAAGSGAIPAVTEQSDSWLVKWDSAASASYYLAEIHRNGSVLSIQQVEKS